MRNPAFGDNLYAMTHGFNVQIWSGATKFLTVSHGPNAFFGINGNTGVTINQPYTNAIGTIGLNPVWQTTGCGNYPGTTNPVDFCTIADAALGDFTTTTGDRKIGTSNTEGKNGAVGSQGINGWYPIDGSNDPDFISVGSNRVHKSGERTGTTTGDLGRTHFDAFTTLVWGSTGTTKTLRQIGSSEILHAGWGKGDSGGPVFAHLSTGEYVAIGMQHGGIGTVYPNGDPLNRAGICNEGVECRVVFHKWSALEGHLGSLNPSTVVP